MLHVRDYSKTLLPRSEVCLSVYVCTTVCQAVSKKRWHHIAMLGVVLRLRLVGDVLKGYIRLDDHFRSTLSPDGWLRTGGRGGEGYLCATKT